MQFNLEKHTVFLTIHGSRAYGTNNKDSDTDYRGIAIAPWDHYLGCYKSFEQSSQSVSLGGEEDSVIFDIRKFIKLAGAGNPNALELLFVDPSSVLKSTKTSELLFKNRDLFLSKLIRKTMAGYAHGQAKRIRSHREWLLNPPKELPTRASFGLSEVSKLSQSEIGAYEHVLAKGEVFSENVMAVLAQEKKYAQAKRTWDQYQNWKETRNEARAELEKKFGYDTKHAYHLVRLMRMAKEVLSGQPLMVFRPDFEELIHIRNGGWSYDELMEWFEKEDSALELICEKSKLPDEPDFEKLNKLCVELIINFLSEGK